MTPCKYCDGAGWQEATVFTQDCFTGRPAFTRVVCAMCNGTGETPMRPRKEWHASLTDDVIGDAVMRSATTLDDPGFCIICGAEQHGVEPDARNYKCEACGCREVYGAEELLIRIAP